MKHFFKQEQLIEASLDEVWNFFADARNLKKLTPSSMNLKVISELNPYLIYEGMVIAYYVSPLFRVPMYWETEIVKVDEKRMFIDIQKKGPFKTWHHQHTFKEVENGVLMVDEVEYELPLGKIGDIFHGIVRQNVRTLFNYRQLQIKSIYNSSNF